MGRYPKWRPFWDHWREKKPACARHHRNRIAWSFFPFFIILIPSFFLSFHGALIPHSPPFWPGPSHRLAIYLSSCRPVDTLPPLTLVFCNMDDNFDKKKARKLERKYKTWPCWWRQTEWFLLASRDWRRSQRRIEADRTRIKSKATAAAQEAYRLEVLHALYKMRGFSSTTTTTTTITH